MQEGRTASRVRPPVASSGGAQTISMISKRFTPLGSSTLIVSPMCDFSSASPIGLATVTSISSLSRLNAAGGLAHELVQVMAVVFQIAQLHRGAEKDHVLRHFHIIGDLGALQPLFQATDFRFVEALVVARGVILSVLLQITQRPGFGDALAQVIALAFEFFQPFLELLLFFARDEFHA